jgi:predicted DNA-binding transcriptional regulator AlpA
MLPSMPSPRWKQSLVPWAPGKLRRVKPKVLAENTMNDSRPYRLVRERDLPTYAGLKRTQIAELIKRGEFPRPIRLSDGGRAKAWLEHELVIWQRQRLAKRDID